METVARQTLYRQTRARGGELRVAGPPAVEAHLEVLGATSPPVGGFVAVSVVSALLAVATPVLAGRVVDAIVHGGPAPPRSSHRRSSSPLWRWPRPRSTMLTRWLSSTIGEGLILDLRTAVFDHVQRMPVAFFTRTRTGALVSRLGNDVIGAQRAFSDTLSGRGVQPRHADADAGRDARHLLADHRAGAAADAAVPAAGAADRRTMATLSRESAIHNATMNTQMTERFSAPGATLVKLFGSPARESERVRGARGPGPRHRGEDLDAAGDVHELADADVGARAGAGLRPRRRAGDRRAPAGRRYRLAGAAADPALRAADRARQCARRDRQCAGQFRAGLRGARPGAADPGAARRARRCPTVR